MLASLFFSLRTPSLIIVSCSANPNQKPPNATNHHQVEQIRNNPGFPVSKEPTRNPDAVIKVPTAPWMKGPLLVRPDEVLDLSKPMKRRSSGRKVEEKTFKALNRRESGIRGRKAMKKIVRNVEKLEENSDSDEGHMESRDDFVFDEYLDHIPENPAEFEAGKRFGGKMPWYREEERFILRRTKKEKAPTAAELSLDEDLLKRLRREAMRMKKWVKVKKAGVTEDVVNDIRLIWRRNELAMVKFDVPLCRNMERAQEIIEMKTGGLVVLSKKDFLVVYRGSNYLSPSKYTSETRNSTWVRGQDYKSSTTEANTGESIGVFRKENETIELVNTSLYEREADRLLDGLGPRYIDWWMRRPFPVDADLLPEVVPGYRPPFRRCPPNTKAKLTDEELTYLRKLAQSLPFHFVLGRNRGLQGLAAAISKLWEKCIISKIAIKWGALNTNNEQMADELKDLTGGVLILRNKYLIILFRGKDFLPDEVADLVDDRERILRRYQHFEETERVKDIETFEIAIDGQIEETSKAGTLIEFQELQRKYGEMEKKNMEMEAERAKLERELREQEHKLSMLKSKIEKSAAELIKLNSMWKPSEEDEDIEILTNEERECLRRIALKMSGSLVLGRRGIFDGVIEGIHQHWKHREVAKVLTMQKIYSRVLYTAKSLEAESGGVLVSVEKLKEGYAIIVYRGKNYRRPPKPMSLNLLTKRKALQRSLEMQRLGSLRFFAYQRDRAIVDLKLKLDELNKRT
ncbi:PREDICTED: chloroplastic group IIA intron splicing facilitator CRS1, chloroplastic [Tarenaya hassleriana]|uniref:chloroplastic group IIA intron splicing facilitator CRS1, chloroplastic n=1 Tax=Tarenaya hassleriana TaxID=28532 RepID=UPI00053C2CC4|nr:PREDICTED: chloroplastic group IIA intron splicing facilitator CRS1, chloroplastic [Tarenaya hassleriana]